MYSKKVFLSAMAFAAAVSTSSLSFAQERISDRDRPDYKRDGINVGGFTLSPQATLQEKHDDNIYSANTGEVDDMITTIAPSLTLDSNWNNHSLSFYTNADVNIYADETDENYTDYAVGFNGRADILRDTFLSAGVEYQELHEDRGSPDSTNNSVEPTEYNEFTANVGFFRGLRKLSFSLDSEFRDLDFKDGNTNSGANIDNDDRDRQILKNSARVGYEFIPNYQAFVAGSVNNREYDNISATNRNSDGYDISVGTSVNLTGKARGEVSVGYMEQDYDSSTLKDVDGVAYGASLLWNPTQLTSVNFGINRSIEETTIANSSAYIATTYSAEIEHEFMRNVILAGNVSLSENDYESSNAIAREDEIISVGADVRYLIHRNVSTNLGYTYTERSSNQLNQDYDKNIVMLGLDVGF